MVKHKLKKSTVTKKKRIEGVGFYLLEAVAIFVCERGRAIGRSIWGGKL
jgi:hypothetical protein